MERYFYKFYMNGFYVVTILCHNCTGVFLSRHTQMMINEVNMKQFKQLGWIPQALLSVVLLSAMSQSHAMSVRERYLQQHPAAKAELSSEKKAAHHQKHHVAEKQVVKKSAKHTAQKHEHHSVTKKHEKVAHEKVTHAKETRAKVEHTKAESAKHHAVKPSAKKETASKATSHQAKADVPRNVPRVVTPKVAPTKFDSQQARDAELALQHQPIKKEAPAKPESKSAQQPAKTKHHATHAATKTKHHVEKHHAVKPAPTHHHKHHRAN
jgi:hypothetical protein